jgi:putative aldouronate transport system permease protein
MVTMKSSQSDKIFDMINGIILTLAALVTIYPLYFIIIASITDPQIINQGEILLYPRDISFGAYKHIFGYGKIWSGYLNTIIYTVAGAGLGTLITLMYSYGLAQKQFSFKKFLNLFAVITMFFNGGLIPTYLVVRNLGLLDSRWAVILVGMVGVWNIMITRTFFINSIPNDLQEAAYVDGCSHFRYFFQILIPLSKAIIVVLLLFYGVAQWNGFFKALIYLSEQSLYPLQLILKDILASTEITDSMYEMVEDMEALAEAAKLADQVKYGVILISALPLLIIYPFLQQFFVQGVTMGSVKG